MQSLQEVRKEWERNLAVVMEVPVWFKNCDNQELDCIIVILKDTSHDSYNVHRYFEANNNNFVVSADLQHAQPVEVLKYIERKFPNGLKTNTI